MADRPHTRLPANCANEMQSVHEATSIPYTAMIAEGWKHVRAYYLKLAKTPPITIDIDRIHKPKGSKNA